MALLVAMETLLPWQKRHVFITLLFEGLWSPYLVHRSLETTAIHLMTGCYGNLVTIATEEYAHIFAVWGNRNPCFDFLPWTFFTIATETYLFNSTVWRLTNFIFCTHVPWGNSNSPVFVAMATKLCLHNCSIWRYRSLKSGMNVPWGNNNPWYFMLLWNPFYRGNRVINL